MPYWGWFIIGLGIGAIAIVMASAVVANGMAEVYRLDSRNEADAREHTASADNERGKREGV